MIGKIERVALREVWKHEALDFTTWLEDNIDVLSDALDINLSSAEREKDAGAFSVDLVAEDDKGDPVVIENQLEKSNHDHLGKLITYLTAIGAKAAIWIVADVRSIAPARSAPRTIARQGSVGRGRWNSRRTHLLSHC